MPVEGTVSLICRGAFYPSLLWVVERLREPPLLISFMSLGDQVALPFTFDAHGTSSVLVIKPSELLLLGPAACLLGQLLTFMLFQPGLC